MTGTGVDPQVHRGYDGGRIELPGDPRVVLDPEELPLLKGKVGHDLVTTDGTTLLGADDKAGVAEIMAAVAYLKRNPGAPHAPIRVCFTVDEEVAGGAEHLDLERFGAKYAYTLDGAAPGEIEAETFNAAKVVVTIRGRSTHPGTAKGQLVNAIKLAADFVAALPRDSLSPETTEEREGFVHPTKISGGAEEAIGRADRPRPRQGEAGRARRVAAAARRGDRGSGNPGRPSTSSRRSSTGTCTR